jgi:hypothetical protein
MLTIILRTLTAVFRSRHVFILENLALRHQIQVLQRSGRRPRLSTLDRDFWVLLSRIWSGWRDSLVIVRPARYGCPMAPEGVSSLLAAEEPKARTATPHVPRARLR